MTTFTDEQFRQQLETVLRTARSQGEARIKTPDGQEYAVRPVSSPKSPFDIPGVDLHLSAEQIVAFVREGTGTLKDAAFPPILGGDVNRSLAAPVWPGDSLLSLPPAIRITV